MATSVLKIQETYLLKHNCRDRMLQINRQNYPRLSLLLFDSYLLPIPVLDLTWLQLIAELLGYTILSKISVSIAPKLRIR